MATLGLTAARDVFAKILADDTVVVSAVGSTARDNGDSTWSVTVHAGEDQIPGLEALGFAVKTVVSDAEQLARWQQLDTQISGTPTA